MKKEPDNTRTTVRLRKSPCRKEWYLHIEDCPVRVTRKETPQRMREYLNRVTTAPIRDKSRITRAMNRSTNYRPKRDLNGIIQCESELDQEAYIYTDNVRKLRQHEYDSVSLYSDTELAQAEQEKKSQRNFIKYFASLLSD